MTYALRTWHCRRFWLASCFTCTWVQLVAQPPPLPACPQSSCISDICSNELLETDWILTYGANGYQACACPPLPSIPTGGMADRIRARRTLYHTNWQRFFQNSANVTPIENCSDSYRFQVDYGGTKTEFNALCDVDRRLLVMFDSIQGWNSIPKFGLLVHQSPCDLHFPRFMPADSTFGGNIFITIPRRFLDDVNTGDELLLFVLLHEIGHGVRATWNSQLADDWAARVGMPMYHQANWTPEFASAYLDKVITQLTGYMRSQELPDVFGRASEQRSNGEEYPNLDCRAHSIRGGYLAPADGNCNHYPTACFENRLIEQEEIVATAYLARPCESNAIRPYIEEIAKPQWLLDLGTLCKRHPWVCDRMQASGVDAEKVSRAIRANTRRLQEALDREKRSIAMP